MTRTFYVTTPIYYVNDVPHLGHAYTTIVADVLARYHRARGRLTFFLTGTDEHGEKIERAATEARKTPKQLADRVVERFRQTWTTLNISNDDFIRTTDPRHAEVVTALWRRIADAGDIYLGEYEGLYCVGCEEYYTETQLDQGKLCPVHGTEVEHRKQPSYFFRMSRYQEPLLDHFARHPDFVMPAIRRNEIVTFIQGGLRDLSVSRTSFNWGIPVPDDPDHVIYVWIDALTNYISALGGFDAADSYRRFWPADVHLIGKDILRHHAVYWPTMLLSAGLPLPRQVLAHGWWTVNGQKMSKSLRNVVEPNMLAEQIGRDALRYFIVRETPLGNDGDFSHEALIQRINAELANDLGNLLNRSLAMAFKYCDGVVPPPSSDIEADPLDGDLVGLARRSRDRAAEQFDRATPSRALESIWELVRGANKYIDSTAPYKMAKDPTRTRRVEEVIYNFLEALRWISLMIGPVMPDKAGEIRRQLGLGLADQQGQLTWPDRWGDLASGLELARGTPLFPRIDQERRAELMSTWQQAAKPAAEETTAMEEQTPQISFDEFSRLDLRVAKVIEAQPVEGADRLLRLKVDIGDEQRQVVAGIATAYSPEQLVGRQVIFLANLKPAKIRGVRSEGMILAAGEKEVLALSTLDRDVTPGTKVR